MASRLQAMQTANRRLLQDVSHELRSPLARLSVALEIARNKGPGPVQGEIDRIALESERLETLVNDVLGLLRETSETAAHLDEDDGGKDFTSAGGGAVGCEGEGAAGDACGVGG